MEGVIISRKSCKTNENAVKKSSKCMLSFTFSKAVQWDRFESFPGQFWPVGLMFVNPVLETAA